MRSPRVAAIATALALTAGCAHTHFVSRVTTSEPDAIIWLDGRPVGRGGRVWALGPPHDGQLLVVGPDGRRARAVVSRRLSAASVELGLYTMGACLILCWAYPAEIHVALPPAPPPVSWEDDVRDSAWLAPPEGAWSEAPDAR